MRRIIKLLTILLFGLLIEIHQLIADTYYHGMPITGTSRASQLDKSIINLMQVWHIPGGSITKIHNGHIVFAHGYGFANIRARRKVKANDLFRIGSISKTITAATILQLIQQKKLHLWWHAYKILSNLTPLNHRQINRKVYQITVKNLLNMSSGWDTSSPNAPDPMFGPWTHTMRRQLHKNGSVTPPTCYEAARMMMSIPMQFQPGAKYSYSNINYCLLGLIINKIIRRSYNYRSYEHYVQTHILKSIGITDMRIGSDKWADRSNQEVTYYAGHYNHNNPDGLPYSYRHTILKDNYADGGWIASSKDIAKFFYALGSGKIIDEYMLKIMFARPSFHHHWWKYFAMGGIRRYAYPYWYWIKTGSFTGTAAIAIYQNNGTAYAALFNTSPPNKFKFLDAIERILIKI